MFVPSYHFKSVADIKPNFLLEKGIRFLVLDVDNTLTTHGHPTPSDWVAEWLQSLHELGIRTVILSNNRPARIKPFAHILGLPFIANGNKPLRGGYERCRRLFGCEKSEMAVIGDQLLTDVWGGCRYGIVSILTDPIELEAAWFYRMKRRIEGVIFGLYKRQGLEGYGSER